MQAEAQGGRSPRDDEPASDLLPEVNLDAVLEATKYIEQMGRAGFSTDRK